MRFLNKKGQNIAEYSILIALVIAVVIGMQTYVKRGIQGRVKDGADRFVDVISGTQALSDTTTAEELSTAWSNISNVTEVTAPHQYDPAGFSRKVTSATITDEEDYAMDKEGTVTRGITRKTKDAAAGDYQEYKFQVE